MTFSTAVKRMLSGSLLRRRSTDVGCFFGHDGDRFYHMAGVPRNKGGSGAVIGDACFTAEDYLTADWREVSLEQALRADTRMCNPTRLRKSFLKQMPTSG